MEEQIYSYKDTVFLLKIKSIPIGTIKIYLYNIYHPDRKESVVGLQHIVCVNLYL